MIKGGFQGLDISGVDLTAQSPTLPGAYAACAAADGKTVLVLTAAGAVQCSVKKVSTNYVLAGITGDGKILSITIGSTDGISVSETEIPSGTEPDFIMDNANGVDLTEYNNSNRYTAPCDGYIKRLVTKDNNTSADYVSCTIFAKQASALAAITLRQYYSEFGESASLVFVKKGFKMYGTKTGTGTGIKSVLFLPLVAAE